MNYINKLKLFLIPVLVIFIYYFLKKNKKFEKFENSLVTNLKTQIDLFNDVFNKITNSDIFTKKNITTENNIKSNNLNSNNINTNNINAKEIQVNKTKISSNQIYTNGDLKNDRITISNNGTIYAKRLNLGGVEIGPEQLKILLGRRHFFIRAISKGGILSDQGTAKFQGNKKDWEKMKIEL